MPGRPPGPVAAILHQPPGGIGNGAVRTTLQRPLDQLLYRRCDLLIAASTALAHELVDHYRHPAERVCVVEPGSDLPSDAAPAGDLRRGRRIAVLCVGNWLPNKGIIELLDAVAALPPELLTLHLAGSTEADPQYAARVQARLRARDLADRVVVHGLLDRASGGGALRRCGRVRAAELRRDLRHGVRRGPDGGAPHGRLAIRQSAQPHRGRQSKDAWWSRAMSPA